MCNKIKGDWKVLLGTHSDNTPEDDNINLFLTYLKLMKQNNPTDLTGSMTEEQLSETQSTFKELAIKHKILDKERVEQEEITDEERVEQENVIDKLQYCFVINPIIKENLIELTETLLYLYESTGEIEMKDLYSNKHSIHRASEVKKVIEQALLDKLFDRLLKAPLIEKYASYIK